jgi:hypothetical protein
MLPRGLSADTELDVFMDSYYAKLIVTNEGLHTHSGGSSRHRCAGWHPPFFLAIDDNAISPHVLCLVQRGIRCTAQPLQIVASRAGTRYTEAGREGN